MLITVMNFSVIKAKEKEVFIMPNIKPISDLRNYTAVWDTVAIGSPVYLTKNGRGCFTIMDIEEQEKAQKYDKMEAQLKLMCELNAGRKSGEEKGWISADDVRNYFKEKTDAE